MTMNSMCKMTKACLVGVIALVAISGVLSLAAPRQAASQQAALQGTAPQKNRQPHIIFIVADDLGWADVGFHGGEIKTPNLDKLASAGARLEQFYVQPLCSPTRAALLTGRYPIRHGLQVGVVRPWAQYGLPLAERTLPQALKEVGYETAICGKWHLGHFQRAYLPTQRGFDHQYGHYNGAIDYFDHTRDGGLDWHQDDKASRDQGYSTHLLAREAVRLIGQQDARKPLFLYVPFTAVHSPLQVPEEYTKPYAHLTRQRRTYAGMVAAMDEAIGQLMDAVDKRGWRQDMLIIFSSDNGGPAPGRVTSNGRLRGRKGTLYEGGVRVPAFATWAGQIKPGTVVNAPLHMVDWYPTLLKLTGAPLQQKLALPLDGQDAWPTITAGKPSPHKEILLNATPSGGAIRMGDWKLVLNGSTPDEGEEGDARPNAQRRQRRQAEAAGGEGVELFNLAQDPYERNNLAAQQPDKVQELQSRYKALAREAMPPKNAPRPREFKVPLIWGEQN